MKRILSEIAALYSLFLIPAMAANAAPAFRITYFPEVAYLNEGVTFVAEGKTDSQLNVFSNGKQILDGVFNEGALELNLALNGPCTLRFQQDSTSVAFRVVQPADTEKLTEKDGFLYGGSMPAILLAQHRIPSKHDRRWETLKFLGRLFMDRRPVVHSCTLLNARIPSEWKSPELAKATGTSVKFWISDGDGSRCEGINALIANADKLETADIAVVTLSGEDYEQGDDGLQFRIKLEWYLQLLESRNIKHVFVVSDLDAYQRQRFSDMLDQVALAASANNAVAVIAGREGARDATSDAAWLKAVMTEINKAVKCR
jgi:hypothetical protein